MSMQTIQSLRTRLRRVDLLKIAVLAAAIASLAGCATKNYVRTQTAPILEQTGQLNDKTAANNRAIKDTDERATSGITKVQGAADAANQSAMGAKKSAEDAEVAANNAVHRADSLAGVVAGLDSYVPMGDISVTFGFDKALLSADDKAQLDAFAERLTNAKSYILEVTGGTDAVGNADYNYQLSQRRADAVVQYLASKYSIPARRFYLIGIGKDKEVADNKTREGRAKNRRVEVRMLSNSATAAMTPMPTSGSTGGR